MCLSTSNNLSGSEITLNLLIFNNIHTETQGKTRLNLRGLPELSMENILQLEHEYEQVLEETKRGNHGTS